MYYVGFKLYFPLTNGAPSCKAWLRRPGEKMNGKRAAGMQKRGGNGFAGGGGMQRNAPAGRGMGATKTKRKPWRF